MNFVASFMAIFSVLGAIDLIFDSRFGIGKEFQKGFMLFGTMAMSMIGMIVLSPFIGNLLQPVFGFVYDVFHIDPSVIPAIVFANDMGGAPLAATVAQNEMLGNFNALVVSSMMGCTISFTLPFALEMVRPEFHKPMLLGFLCGIVTIPLGCFIAGVLYRIPLMLLVSNMLPMILFSAIISAGLIFAPEMCVKVLGIFGKFIHVLIIVGLGLGTLRFLTGIEILPGLATLEEGAAVCLNASAVMTGAFPFMAIISRLLRSPMKALGKKIGISEISAFGFLSSLATSVTTFENMHRMDNKGIVLNSAFAISGAFTFAGHLAFTMSFDSSMIVYVVLGKLISGFSALFLALIVYKKTNVA